MQNVSIRNTTVLEKHWLENVGPFAKGEKRRDRNDLRLGKSWKIKVVWNFRFFLVVVHVENDHLYSTENRIKVARSSRQGCYLRKFFGSPSHISRSQLIDKRLVSRCSKLDFASNWTRLSFDTFISGNFLPTVDEHTFCFRFKSANDQGILSFILWK